MAGRLRREPSTAPGSNAAAAVRLLCGARSAVVDTVRLRPTVATAHHFRKFMNLMSVARQLLLAALLFLVGVATALPAAGQTRGADLVGATEYAQDDGQPLVLYRRSWAVVIGINQYEQLPKLGGAVRDAQKVSEYLTGQGFEVTLLTDGAATRSNITELIGDKLPSKVGPEDRVLVYFAGHGLSRGEGDSAMGYLMPVEGKRDSPAATAISMAELQRWFAQYRAKHVLYVADACYSGLSIGTRSVGLSPETKAYVREVTKRPVRVALVAGNSGQEAHEYQGHGLFTWFLLEGWKGGADGNRDGLVTTDELAAFVKPAVSQFAASQFRASQHPQFARMGEGEFLFLAPHTRVPQGPKGVAEGQPPGASGQPQSRAAETQAAQPESPKPAASKDASAKGNSVRVAVLYFDYDGQNPELATFKKAIAEMLVTDLAGQPGVTLVERSRLEEIMAELKLQQSKAIDPATSAKIGKLLGAEYLVLGRYVDQMGKLRLSARVVHVQTGAIVAGKSALGKMEDFLDMEQDLAASLREVLQTIKPPQAPDAPKTARRAAQKINQGVLVAYSAALDAQDRGDNAGARQLLERALALDPAFAPAKDAMKRLNAGV